MWCCHGPRPGGRCTLRTYVQAIRDSYYIELQYDGLQFHQAVGTRLREYLDWHPSNTTSRGFGVSNSTILGCRLNSTHVNRTSSVNSMSAKALVDWVTPNTSSDIDLYRKKMSELRTKRAVQCILYTHVRFWVTHYTGRVTSVRIDHSVGRNWGNSSLTSLDVSSASEATEVMFTYSVKWQTARTSMSDVDIDSLYEYDMNDYLSTEAAARPKKRPTWRAQWEWDFEIRRVCPLPPLN